MANGRFEEIPATTTLDDLEKHNRNWDKTDAEFTNQQSDYNSKITAEQQARASSDSNLQAQITKEVQDRMTAVTAHISAIAAHAAAAITLNPVTGLTANNLQTAVEQLRTMLTTIIAGPAPSAAEIQAARVGADNVARASLDILIKEIHAKLIAANNQTTSLTRGQNLITASEAGPVAATVKGNTLVNLLGKDGNFEVDSNADGVADGWVKTDSSQTYTVETATDVPVGSKFQRFTASGGGIGTGVYHPISMVAGRYYLILAMARITTSTGNAASVRLSDDSGVQLAVSANATTSTWTHLWIKRQATGEETKLRITCSGGTGSTILDYDAVRMYEVSAEEYAKAGVDPSLLTGDQINARYPYVDSVKHITNPVITKIGKNLLPPFTVWTVDGGTQNITGPYEVEVTTTNWNHGPYIVIDSLPLTQYTIRVGESSGVALDIASRDSANTNTAMVSGGLLSTYTFTTPANSVRLWIKVKNSVQTGKYRAANVQLELGSSATPFEPRNDDYLYALTTLAGYGGVNDVLTVRGTEATVLRRWKTDVHIPGTLLWTVSSDEAGYKTLYTDNFGSDGLSNGLCVGSRPDGSPIGTMYPSGIANRAIVSFNAGTSKLYMNIPDSVSGWGEDYQPLPDERKAPFWGWKMNNGTFGQPYNGTGTKTWTRWDATSNTGAVTTVPTAMAEGYTPYKLSYQLATPVTEVVPVEGSLANHAGANLYEVSEGVIVREPIIPRWVSQDKVFYINTNDSYYPNKLKYRTANILDIHKSGRVDKSWTKANSSTVAYGGQYAFSTTSDSTAEYTVTYLALDKYALTAPVVEGALEYNTSSKMVQDTLVQRTTDAETAITIHDRILAQHTARLLALEA